MALVELIEQASDGDLIREMLAFAAERMMEMEVEAKTGAPMGARTASRTALRQRFLRQNEQRDRRHSDDVHHPEREENGEEQPAAAKAIEAVEQPHPESAPKTAAPRSHDEADRVAAARQTERLPRGELVDAGRAQDGAAEAGGAALRHGERLSRRLRTTGKREGR